MARRQWVATRLFMWAGAASLLVAVVNLVDFVDGCGRAWHFRPGHGDVSGGELSDAQRAALLTSCRATALPPYRRGVRLGAAGATLVTLGAAASAVSRRSLR